MRYPLIDASFAIIFHKRDYRVIYLGSFIDRVCLTHHLNLDKVVSYQPRNFQMNHKSMDSSGNGDKYCYWKSDFQNDLFLLGNNHCTKMTLKGFNYLGMIHLWMTAKVSPCLNPPLMSREQSERRFTPPIQHQQCLWRMWLQTIRHKHSVADKHAQVKLMKSMNKPLPDGGAEHCQHQRQGRGGAEFVIKRERKKD